MKNAKVEGDAERVANALEAVRRRGAECENQVPCLNSPVSHVPLSVSYRSIPRVFWSKRVPVEQLKAAAAEEKESKEEFERAINSIRAQMEQVLTRSLFASSLFSVFVYSSIPTLIFIDHQIDYEQDILKLHRGLVYQKTRIMSCNLIQLEKCVDIHKKFET